MKIEQLEILMKLCQLGSFSAVAELMRCNPTSVARALDKLEVDLGVTLFHRSTRKLTLTPAGEVFVQKVPAILEMFESAKQQALDTKNQLAGTLRITLPLGFGEAHIIPLMPQFCALHPDLKIELLITDECLDLVQQKIDVGVRIGPVKEENWVARPLKVPQFLLCASPSFLAQHRIHTPLELADVPCINYIPKSSASTWYYQAQGEQAWQKIIVNQVILATHEQAALSLCKADLGLALLPDWLASRAIESGDLVACLTHYKMSYEQSEDKIWATYANRQYIPAKTRAFIDFLTEQFKA